MVSGTIGGVPVCRNISAVRYQASSGSAKLVSIRSHVDHQHHTAVNFPHSGRPPWVPAEDIQPSEGCISHRFAIWFSEALPEAFFPAAAMNLCSTGKEKRHAEVTLPMPQINLHHSDGAFSSRLRSEISGRAKNYCFVVLVSSGITQYHLLQSTLTSNIKLSIEHSIKPSPINTTILPLHPSYKSILYLQPIRHSYSQNARDSRSPRFEAPAVAFAGARTYQEATRQSQRQSSCQSVPSPARRRNRQASYGCRTCRGPSRENRGVAQGSQGENLQQRQCA
jgi:hypothetical protein